MISLEMARKLKEAKLPWTPQIGDRGYNKDGKLMLAAVDEADCDLTILANMLGRPFSEEYARSDAVFAPRLDQLLAEIERQDYWWQLDWLVLDIDGVKKYDMQVSKRHSNENQDRGFRGDSANEAVAAALLWILKEGAKDA